MNPTPPADLSPTDLSLADLSLRLRQFAAERDWEQFHTPKNLATALVAEAGELAAEFQWLTAAQSSAPTAEQLERIRAESADVPFPAASSLRPVRGNVVVAAAPDGEGLDFAASAFTSPPAFQTTGFPPSSPNC